ncbi:hypothetical protein H0H92_013308 [Tricholoma furcatifolium]|nr:hypothetical protein H0H92_013308 [Tricholoma furcatifolium]
MSISIDDLSIALSASHVGQEAMDLAALQAQLAKMLFGQSSTPQMIPRRTSFTQPCNTPTKYTETQALARADDMEEDERMVEDLLIPRSPSSSTLQFSRWPKNASEVTSSFATTDPFYLAQFQTQHQNNTPYSAFTELGKLPQQSPFNVSSPRRDSLSTSPSSPHTLETHSFFVAASAAFDH